MVKQEVVVLQTPNQNAKISSYLVATDSYLQFKEKERVFFYSLKQDFKFGLVYRVVFPYSEYQAQ